MGKIKWKFYWDDVPPIIKKNKKDKDDKPKNNTNREKSASKGKSK